MNDTIDCNCEKCISHTYDWKKSYEILDEKLKNTLERIRKRKQESK